MSRGLFYKIAYINIIYETADCSVLKLGQHGKYIKMSVYDKSSQ